MPDKISFIEPDECKQCGWKPPHQTNDNQVIAVANTWLIIPLPGSVVWLYVCPKCQAVWANKNAVNNVEMLKKAKDSKIVRPNFNQQKGLKLFS